VNELAGWTAILVGVLLGVYMGVKFQSETWLGGYSSLARRMVRLGHVAFIALGMLNIQLGRTLENLTLPAALVQVASIAMIGGNLLMPACCLAIARGSRRFEIFAAPIVCLITALVLAIGGLIR